MSQFKNEIDDVVKSALELISRAIARARFHFCQRDVLTIIVSAKHHLDLGRDWR